MSTIRPSMISGIEQIGGLSSLEEVGHTRQCGLKVVSQLADTEG